MRTPLIGTLAELVEALFAGDGEEMRTYGDVYLLRKGAIYYRTSMGFAWRNLLRLHHGKVSFEYLADNIKHIAKLLPLVLPRVTDKYRNIEFLHHLFPDKARLSTEEDDAVEKELENMLTVTGENPKMYALFQHLRYNVKWAFYYYAYERGKSAFFFEFLALQYVTIPSTRTTRTHIGLFLRRKTDWGFNYIKIDLGPVVQENIANYFRGMEQYIKLNLLLGREVADEQDPYMP